MIDAATDPPFLSLCLVHLCLLLRSVLNIPRVSQVQACRRAQTSPLSCPSWHLQPVSLWPAPLVCLSMTPLFALALLQVLMARVYGKEVDIWSLGVVLYIVLGGYAPFDGACEQQVGSQRVHGGAATCGACSSSLASFPHYCYGGQHRQYRGCPRGFSACCTIATSMPSMLHQPGSSAHPATFHHGALTTPRTPFRTRHLTPPAPGMPCLCCPQILNAIVYQPLRFDDPTWNEISNSAKDLISRCDAECISGVPFNLKEGCRMENAGVK